VFPRKSLIAVLFLTTAVAFAQQPQVKVNVLNVCSPSADDQKELSAALSKLPLKPVFVTDYEISRGRSTLDESTSIPGMQPLPAGVKSTANWVRVRHEFPASSPYSNVQYSFSVDEANMVETLVLRVRDPKDIMQVSIEDSASAVTSAAAMLSRCSGGDGNPAPNQSAYEPIFHSASAAMNRYREILHARRLVPEELARLGVVHKSPVSPAKK
jgi:hypothetical protein